MRRAVPGVPLEEIARRRDEEREDERVGLGEVECALDVVLCGPRVAEHGPCEGVEDERIDDRDVANHVRRAGLWRGGEHRREVIDRRARIPLGEMDRGERGSRVGILELAV